jgi:4-amino-4-deoxy-L-arabinose transferase-like glycosyltransferase
MTMTEQTPEETKIKLRQILMVLSVFVTLIGLVELYSTPINWDLVIPKYLWLVLLGLVMFIASMLVPPIRRLQAFSAHLALPVRTGWIVLSALLSVLAAITMVAFIKGGRLNYIPVLTFWLSAGLGYLAAFQPGWLTKAQWRDWFSLHKNELLLLGLVVIVGAALRFYKLGLVPSVLNGDEGRMGVMALSTDFSELANPFALWENFGAFYLQAIDFCFKIFGNTPFALRFLPALGGVLAILAVYLLARQIAGKRVALVSAALLAFSHTHIHFSRTAAVGYIQSTWLVPLEFYFLLTGIEKRSSWRAALAGILIGIHFSIYLTSQIVVALVMIFMVIAFLAFRSWLKPAFKQVLVFWGGLSLMFIPEAVYISRYPNMFLERLNADGTFQSGWLKLTMGLTGKSAVQLLAERVLHAFLALIYYPAVDFYGSSIPMLSLIAAMLFLVGLVIVLLRKQTPASLLLNGYFWGFTLAVGIFAVPPSADSYRMLVALPAAFILAGIGLDYILGLVGLGGEKLRTAYAAVSGIVVVSLLIFNMWSYFDDFIGHCLYGDNLPGRFASYLGTYADTVEDPLTPIYLLSDDIYFAGSHASTQFLSHNRTIINIPDPLGTLLLHPGDIVIAPPSRIDELATWASAHLGGALQYRYDCKTTIMLIYQAP